RTRPSIRPRHPFWMPTHSPPPPVTRATTPRMAALRPGQSPPAVSTPTFISVLPSRLGGFHRRRGLLDPPRGGDHQDRHGGGPHRHPVAPLPPGRLPSPPGSP